MRRLLPLLLFVGCQQATSTAPAPPADHTPVFRRHHALEVGCERCHGPDPCLRCHRSALPDDHRPGFAGAPHAIRARLDPDRCATCHTRPHCGICH